MKKIGIFFGSDTGNTEKVAKLIHDKLKDFSSIFDIAECKEDEILLYDFLILGIPTWYYGELQCDWDDFLPKLRNMNFSGKKVALFGCGDQEDYPEYFCDALGIMYQVLSLKGASFVGHWPSSGYNFISSKGLIDKNNFVGLPLDEDRQPEHTIKRIHGWIKKISKEIQNS